MEISDKNFEEEVLKSKLPVLVEFWGSWCIPCKKMEEILNSLEEEYKGKIKICKININRNPKTATKYQITGVPTYLIFKNGKILKREIGAKSREQLKRIIKERLNF